ncbi:MAG: NUDIX hydrolase [Thermoguttaceae bacterium]
MSYAYNDPRRHGVVAVVLREGRFLVIRRSDQVIAPGRICFPGGGIEGGESEEETLVREIREELGVSITPVRRLWRSVTPWNVELAWWLGEIDPTQTFVPNLAEVASIDWVSTVQMRELADLLESMHPFLDALQRGEIRLESRSWMPKATDAAAPREPGRHRGGLGGA